MDNIILIGMPGCGKSTVGFELSKKLNYKFIDTDTVIKKDTGKELSEIIYETSYDNFLKIEGNAGKSIHNTKQVIATGGSMVLIPDAMKHLKSIGHCIWLKVDTNSLEKRLKRTMHSRGVATPKKMTVKEIIEYRTPFYEKYADIVIDCEDGVENVVNNIVNKLGL